jgi:hypothetical protein
MLWTVSWPRDEQAVTKSADELATGEDYFDAAGPSVTIPPVRL